MVPKMAAILSNNKVAIFTDLHLGVHQNSDFWLNVALKWADWFVSELENNNIDTVIFCGDWMHYRDAVEVKTLHYHSLILQKLSKFKLLMIPGNHCCYYKNTSDVHSLSIMKGNSNIQIFDNITSVYFNDKKFTFCPWGCNIKDIPQSDVVFGHFELQNFRMNGHKICEHGDDPDYLTTKSNLVFSGHFHQRDEKTFESVSKIIYVGNPFQTDFGDAYQTKGYYLLDIDTLKFEFKENTLTPVHLKVSLSEIIINKDPIAYFSNNFKGNIIKLIIDKNISTDHLDMLVSKITTFKPADLKIDYDVNYNKIKTHEELVDSDIKGAEIENIVTEFVSMLDINNKQEIIKYTISLYNKSIA